MKIVIEGTPEEIRALMQKELCCKQSSYEELSDKKKINIWEAASLINQLAILIQNKVAKDTYELFVLWSHKCE